MSQSGNVHIEIYGRWCEIFMRAKYEGGREGKGKYRIIICHREGKVLTLQRIVEAR
jgi:hypothetical protein